MTPPAIVAVCLWDCDIDELLADDEEEIVALGAAAEVVRLELAPVGGGRRVWLEEEVEVEVEVTVWRFVVEVGELELVLEKVDRVDEKGSDVVEVGELDLVLEEVDKADEKGSEMMVVVDWNCSILFTAYA